MLDIGISIIANSFNNKWPCVKIYYNKCDIDDVECNKVTELQYTVDSFAKNTLDIELYNKSFGSNNIWDVDQNGQGLEAQVTDITLDGVSIGHLLTTLNFKTHCIDTQLPYESEEFKSKYRNYDSNGMLIFNGKLTFEFETPVYEFLIDKKYKTEYNKNLAYFSNKTEAFHYELGLARIEEIKKIIAAIHV